jgi:hypothetical protein
MIIIDLIYLSIYSIFRRILPKNSNNSPEILSMGFLALLTGFSLDILYTTCFYLSPHFSKKVSGFILFMGAVSVCLYVSFYHLKENRINVKYKKYKPYLFIPGLLVVFWVYIVVKQFPKI